MTTKLELTFLSFPHFYSLSNWSLLHPQGQKELKHDLFERKDLEPRRPQARRRYRRELSLPFPLLFPSLRPCFLRRVSSFSVHLQHTEH